MAKITITKTFTGYPDGTDASKTTYSAGAVIDDLDDDFAKMIVAKGLAVYGDALAAATDDTASTKPEPAAPAPAKQRDRA
jgi:hypothetical protein